MKVKKSFKIGIVIILFVIGYVGYARWTCSGPLFSYIYYDAIDGGGRVCIFD